MANTNSRFEQLSQAQRRELNAWLEDFAESWHENLLAEHVGRLPLGDSQLRRPALIELVKIDLARQWQQGRHVTVEEYLQSYPEIGTAEKAPIDLLLVEREVRRRCGFPQQLSEFVKRFPHRAKELSRLAAQSQSAPGADDPTTSQGFGVFADPDGRNLLGVSWLESLAEEFEPSGERTEHYPLSAESPSPPEIPGYEIVAVLGHGGMGVVYRARQTKLKRQVAVKMIRAGHLARPEELARFRTEAEAAARLHHANIVQIYEIGEHEGSPYFSMEYIAGENLSQRLEGAPLPPIQAAALTETLARAMDYAHQQGVIHRDLKPANVILQSADPDSPPATASQEPQFAANGSLTPKITDFGLAKKLDEDTAQTHTGQIMGTPSYMAPEQASGNTDEIGPLADVYALGAILYEMLTGHPPFRAATVPDTLEQVRTQEPVPPRRLQAKVPRDLNTICLKCLEKEPARRYGSAEQLAEDLRRFQSGEPIRARPIGPVRRGIKWARRRPATAAFVVTALALLAGGVWFYWDWSVRRLQSAAAQARIVNEVRGSLGESEKRWNELHQVLRSSGGVFRLLDNPADWERRLQAAKFYLDRAKAVGQNAEEKIDNDLSAQMRELERKLKAADADRILARRLENVRLESSIVIDGKPNIAIAAKEYPKEFRKARIEPVSGNEEQIARQIEQSPIHEQLLAALEFWALVEFSRKNTQLVDRLLRVARAADKQPWLVRFRHPKTWTSRQALQELADEALKDKKLLARLSPQTLGVFGDLLRARGAKDEDFLRQVQILHPKDFWINARLGEVLDDKSSFEAIGFCRVAAAARPTSVAAWNNLGNALLVYNPDAAIEAYKKALALNPKLAAAWNNMGVGYLLKNDFAAAIRAHQNALRLDAKYPGAWLNLGIAYAESGEISKAAAAFEKAVGLNGNYAKAWKNLGNARVQQHKLPAAIGAFEKALAIDPKSAKTWRSMGIARFKQKDLSGAIDAWQKCVAIDPGDAKTWLALANALKNQGDLPAAAGAYRKGLEIKPDRPKHWVHLGNTLWKLNDSPAAIKAYKMAMVLKPKYAKAYWGIALPLRDQGNFAESIAALETAVDIIPSGASERPILERLLEKGKRLLALDHRLPAILKSKTAGVEELLASANLCWRYKKRYRDAVQLYAAAFAREPKGGFDPKRRLPFHAGKAAILAATGKGKGADSLEKEQRADLRRQALGWLQKDIQYWNKRLQNDLASAYSVQEQMKSWQQNPEFAEVRGEKLPAAFPTEEQIAWKKFWFQVERLRQKARACYKETRLRGTLTGEQKERVHLVKMQPFRVYAFLFSERPSKDACFRVLNTRGKVIADTKKLPPKARIIFTSFWKQTYKVVVSSGGGIGRYEIIVREFSRTK